MGAGNQAAESRTDLSTSASSAALDEDSAGAREGTWAPTLALVAVVLATFAVYAVLASLVDSPFVFSDELLYFDAAASITEGDGLTIRGEAYRYAPLYPALLAGVHWATPDREVAYEVAKLLNALLVALTAIPVFLLARRLLPPWPSVAAATLSVAIPSAMYVSVVMTESLAYLVFSWALLAIVLALERPSVPRQFAAMATILVATGARTQFVVLYGVYVLGLVMASLLLPARRHQTRSWTASYWPTLAVLVLGLVALVGAWTVGGSDNPVGAYSVLLRRYDVADIGFWLVYQLANLELYLAVVPLVVAPIVLVARLARARQGSERDAAFVTLFLTTNATFLLLTAAFNTTVYADNALHDRPVFYVVPLWLIVLFVWVVDGAPRPLIPAAVGAALALALPLRIPFSDFARDEVRQQFNAVTTPLWAGIGRAASELGASGRVFLVAFSVLLVLAALFVPASRVRLLVVTVVALLLVMSELNWAQAVRVARPPSRALPADERLWLDERVPDGRFVTLLIGGGESCPGQRRESLYATDFLGFYLTEFFNSSVRRAVYVGPPRDSLPVVRAGVARDGRLVTLPSRDPLVADYVVAQRAVRLEGRRLATGTAGRLVLWETGGVVRTLGIDSTPEFRAAACARGR